MAPPIQPRPLPPAGLVGAALARNQQEAQELDAADGIMDGKFHGLPIRIIPPDEDIHMNSNQSPFHNPMQGQHIPHLGQQGQQGQHGNPMNFLGNMFHNDHQPSGSGQYPTFPEPQGAQGGARGRYFTDDPHMHQGMGSGYPGGYQTSRPSFGGYGGSSPMGEVIDVKYHRISSGGYGHPRPLEGGYTSRPSTGGLGGEIVDVQYHKLSGYSARGLPVDGEVVDVKYHNLSSGAHSAAKQPIYVTEPAQAPTMTAGFPPPSRMVVTVR